VETARQWRQQHRWVNNNNINNNREKQHLLEKVCLLPTEDNLAKMAGTLSPDLELNGSTSELIFRT
jgi:hypothetical protein